jgi:hypothetical protein
MMMIVQAVLLAAFTVIGFIQIPSDNTGPAYAAQPQKRSNPTALKPSAPVAAARQYAQALAAGDRVAAGQLDFACQFGMVARSASRLAAFPPDSDPTYAGCWEQLVQTHQSAVEHREQGVDVVWPGKGSLVFFREPLAGYPSSFFAMDLLGTSPPAGGLQLEPLDSTPLPAASFRLRDDAPLLATPASLVRMRVGYKDPLTSPLAYAPGAYQWANTVKRPRAALKTVTVQWVVLTGLRKLGFPGDAAVVNLPVGERGGASVPFVTETSRYVENSAAWWTPADAPGTMLAAVARAALFPELPDRMALLNRILIIDPFQPEALTVLSRDLYQTLLNAGAAEHKVLVGDAALANRFNEFYWDTYAQTTRMDIALGMEMGGLSKPTPADYLYRAIPVMENLAKVRPEDLDNRLRLGIVYRWNNDQLAAIATHEALVKDIPPERADARARALIELAWSRIAKVSWNRIFDDPGIIQAYKEAEEAYKLTDRPLDKFAASYTMTYSLIFTPHRDNHAILEHLTEARRWFKELPGSSSESWRYLLANDNLKGVIEADPAFKTIAGS